MWPLEELDICEGGAGVETVGQGVKAVAGESAGRFSCVAVGLACCGYGVFLRCGYVLVRLGLFCCVFVLLCACTFVGVHLHCCVCWTGGEDCVVWSCLYA